jgi:hypothetical protein
MPSVQRIPLQERFHWNSLTQVIRRNFRRWC